MSRSSGPARSRVPFVLLIAALVVGAALRFSVLDRQIVWNDEVATQLRLAGLTRAELLRAYDGRPRTVAAWRGTLARPAPGGIPRVIAALRRDEPQWPPAFYVLGAAWRTVAGPSVLAIRALAALFGVAAIAACAWLAAELFGGIAAAAAAAWLFALSPWQVVFAREARAYSLLALLILLASAALLRAARTGARGWWIAYALLAVAGLYTDTLFAAVLAGHALWVAFGPSRARWRSYATVVAVVVVAWAPWLLAMLHGRATTIDELPSTDGYRLATFVVPKWLYNLALPFWSVDTWAIGWGWVIAPVLAAVAVALGALARDTAARGRLAFLAALALPEIAVLILADQHWHKALVLIPRYQFPLAIALTLAAAALLANVATGRDRRRSALAAASVLVVASAVSSFDAVGRTWWWDSWYAASYPEIVRAIDAAPHPMVVAAAPTLPFGVVDNGLRDDAELVLVPTAPTACRRFTLDAPGRDVFWLAPPKSLRDEHDAAGSATLHLVVRSLAEQSTAYRFARWLARLGAPPPARNPGTVPRWATLELWRADATVADADAEPLFLCS